MSFLSGGAKPQSAQTPAVSGLQLQSSAYGKAVPLVYGSTRIAPNLIWYGDFKQTGGSAGSGKSGGKGGGGGGKSGGGADASPTYAAALAMALCEGPIDSVQAAWADKAVTTPAALGLGLFTGSFGQAPWGYLTAAHPGQDLGYSGVAYLATAAYDLKASAQLPNHSFEVKGFYSTSVAGTPDADPSLVVADLLTDPRHGAGFPPARLGDLAPYRAYCLANGLWISPAYTDQQQAAQMLDEIARNTNSAVVWSSGRLTLVPYGDAAVSGNGYVYAPPAAPEYDLGDDDFIAAQGSDPVQLQRRRPSDQLNAITLEYFDRAHQYNPAVAEAKDQAMIDAFGLRADGARTAHLFCDARAAQLSCQLQLQRESVRNLYAFALDQRYILLDPMDIVTLTDAALGLDRQWVRIVEIAEGEDGTLAVTAEEYLAGTGAAALEGFAQGQGFAADYNADPGHINPPLFFEPTDELAQGLEIWVALSGGAGWGGCEIHVSGDGESYARIGRITGAARMGVLSSPLPEVAEATTGPTIDDLSTLSVDISSVLGAQLASGSQGDMLAGNTLCYVDGELVAYQDAVLTAPGRYDLTRLDRGMYGTLPAAHPAGSSFARLDGQIFRFPFTQDRIGAQLFFKFPSFNPYGGGRQLLAEVEPYAYRVKGTALASPLPEITGLTSVYVANLTQITWDEVTDFRPVLYELRRGAGPLGAQILGRVAHPPFTASGDGTYWVAAVSQPVAGLTVYSDQWRSIAIAGATLNRNVVAVRHEDPAWSGSVDGQAVASAGAMVLAGGDFLALEDVLGAPSFLSFGSFAGAGSYTIPAAHRIDVGRVAPCLVTVSYDSIGQQQPGVSFLGIGDFIGSTDLLANAASANVDVRPEIRTSPDGVSFGPWQGYVPGIYNARVFDLRMQIVSKDAQTQAILETMSVTVDAPDRIDDYIGFPVAAAGTTLSYAPNGGAPAPFNGGPGGALLPQLQVQILGQVAGDVVSITGQTLAGCQIRILNGGVGVARTCNIMVKGY